jgi:hypothetical protein
VLGSGFGERYVVSDSAKETPPGSGFRSSRVDRRKDETIILNAASLSETVAGPKEGKFMDPAISSEETDELADSSLGRILVILGIIALVIAVAAITYVNLIQN